MALPLLEQQFHHVDLLGDRLRQQDLVRLRCIGSWFADPQSRSFENWNNVRNLPIAIKGCDRLPALNDTEKFAQSGFELGNFHAAALAHGGTSEGAPGLRAHYNPDFYAAYVRDPDSNKLAAVCRGFTKPQ